MSIHRGTSYCGVRQCYTYRSGSISMHRIPKSVMDNPKKLLVWKTALKMTKPIPKKFVICSKHFEPNKIIVPINRGQLQKKRLVESAIPTLNLPDSWVPKKLQRKYNAQLKKPQDKTLQEERSEEYQGTTGVGSEESQYRTLQNEVVTQVLEIETLEHYHQQDPLMEEPITFAISVETQTQISQEDKSFQVCEDDLQPFPFSCGTDEELKTVTGIPTFDIFDKFLDLCNALRPEDLGKTRIPLENRIVLTMFRLKHKLPNEVIANIFKVSEKTAKACFEHTKQLLEKSNVMFIYKDIFERIKR